MFFPFSLLLWRREEAMDIKLHPPNLCCKDLGVVQRYVTRFRICKNLVLNICIVHVRVKVHSGISHALPVSALRLVPNAEENKRL